MGNRINTSVDKALGDLQLFAGVYKNAINDFQPPIEHGVKTQTLSQIESVLHKATSYYCQCARPDRIHSETFVKETEIDLTGKMIGYAMRCGISYMQLRFPKIRHATAGWDSLTRYTLQSVISANVSGTFDQRNVDLKFKTADAIKAAYANDLSAQVNALLNVTRATINVRKFTTTSEKKLKMDIGSEFADKLEKFERSIVAYNLNPQIKNSDSFTLSQYIDIMQAAFERSRWNEEIQRTFNELRQVSY